VTVFSPSDLHAFLACPHLFALEFRRRQRGEPRAARSAEADLVARRGEAHERAQLAAFRAMGSEVVEVVLDADWNWARAAADTLAAMRAGADVVYQAVLVDAQWRGVADFLVRTDTPSAFGGWSYEAWDTKLARRSRPYFLLQLCFYSAQVGRHQDGAPDWMKVVLGDGRVEAYRFGDFSAYAQRLWRRLEATAAELPDTYPHPVAHCALCHHAAACESVRERDDHLSLIAGIRREQVERLGQVGIASVAALATAPQLPAVRIGARTLEALRHQARLQHGHRATGTHRFELLPPEEARGLELLPRPDPGDVFFDMEGYPYFEIGGGLEYLFGAVMVDTGRPRFCAFQAGTRGEERAAFEQFIDMLVARLRRFPALHVYHYAHYEPTALKRLAMQHGTRETELDALLRRETFVDLYQVVRQALRISHPSYSIKAVRQFFMPEAGHGAVTGGGESIVAFERWLATGDPDILAEIARYNKEDCVSTWRLRDWLLERRDEAVARFGPVAWREAGEMAEEAPESATFGDAERDALLGLAPGQPSTTGDALVTLADVVTYHRREAKPGYWEYFARKTKSFDELILDTEAIAGIVPDGPSRPEKRSLIYPCRVEPQDCKLTADSPVEDPRPGTPAVHIHSLDLAMGRLELRRERDADAEPLPTALIAGGPVRTEAQRRALVALARDVVTRGIDVRDAARDLLLRRPPRIRNHPEGAPLQTPRLDTQQALVGALDNSYLFVQGPPGTGKTWTGARLIASLLSGGRRVGVMGPSHKAIHNLLDEVERVAATDGLTFRGLKKAGRSDESCYESAHISSTGSNAVCENSDAQLLAGTSWLFAREGLRQSLDTLFIDEAGQVALADALAVSSSARNLVLLGDPQQLAHVSQGVHPAGSGLSVLAHLLGDQATVATTHGLFLEQTWRMHGDVCRFVSAMSYDSRLRSEAGCGRQRVDCACGLSGTGLRFIAVEHTGNAQRSDEEAARLADEVRRLLSRGTFTDREGVRRPIRPEDILVVAPFNLHVHCLRERLPAGVEAGTVDKFQGREAPIVFFAMGSSSGEDVPRGMGFLFSRNRLNVALSRARALAVIVASPALLGANCGSIDEMRLVNLLCRFADQAEAGTKP
jgi:uncharacterized protein